MNKVIISGLVALLLAGCEDSDDPAGPGDEALGQVFEVDDVSFDYDSDLGFWSAAIDIPSRIDVYESDVVLAYRLVDSVSDGTGGEAYVWEMLPNVYFLDADNIIQYVFNHTFFDVELIIDGNHDLRNLDSGFTDDQSFRFVVAPAAFVTQSGVDIADYEAVLKALQTFLPRLDEQ